MVPRGNLHTLALLVVLTTAIVFLFLQQESEGVDGIHAPFVDKAVTTEMRLLKSIPEGASEPRSIVQLPAYTPPTLSQCTDTGVGKEKSYEVLQVERALGYRSAIAGFHKKAGMLSAVQWRPEFKDDRNVAVSYWFATPQKQRARCLGSQPPFQFPGCTVLINHHYKFIWIRGARVGGSAIEESLGWVCSNGDPVSKKSDKAYCSEALHDNKEVSMKEVQAYWNAYFVFAFIRNPYSRFASAYTHVSGLMSNCPKLVNFNKLCDSPFLLVKICSTLSCCWPGAISHHMQHAIEQSSCLFTNSGEMAVDFIGQTERLASDLQKILNEINKRAEPNLPKLKIKNGTLPKVEAMKRRRPLHLFMRSSTCLSRVEHYYWRDFDQLGYKRITASVQ